MKTNTVKQNAEEYIYLRDAQFALYDEYAKAEGLTINTFFVLNVLFQAEKGLTQKEICQGIHHSKQTVSLIVKSLLRDGKVTLEENPKDKRNTVVKLTPKGLAFASKPVKHISSAESKAMGELTEEEQKALVELSKKFTKHLVNYVQEKE